MNIVYISSSANSPAIHIPVRVFSVICCQNEAFIDSLWLASVLSVWFDLIFFYFILWTYYNIYIFRLFREKKPSQMNNNLMFVAYYCCFITTISQWWQQYQQTMAEENEKKNKEAKSIWIWLFFWCFVALSHASIFLIPSLAPSHAHTFSLFFRSLPISLQSAQKV